MRKFFLSIFLFVIVFTAKAQTQQSGTPMAEWQWSVALKNFVSPENGAAPKAYLWIPTTCDRVKAVVFGQHNMSEENLFENPKFRDIMAREQVAIVWVTPAFEMEWNEAHGCREIFERIMADLAAASGYDELSTAPVVPIGHSAMATFPWNFAAWNPDRTLALISLHGDAPRTNLTGYGRANLEWGRTRNIDGIPALMIMGEYEWWEDRLRPAIAFRMMYPSSCISFLGDAGRGHFDVSDHTAEYIGLFIGKAIEYRLSGNSMQKVDCRTGWLADRWRPNQSRRTTHPAPAAKYKGDAHEAFWYFDREMAETTEIIYASERGKQGRFINYKQNGQQLKYREELHARIETKPDFENDGMTFHLQAGFTDSSYKQEIVPSDKISVSRICGPVEVINDTTFRICFGRGEIYSPRRGSEIWLVAEAENTQRHKSAVQQLLLHIPYKNTSGTIQHIDFPALQDMRTGQSAQKLNAVSDSGLPISYFVEEGPATIIDGALHLLPIPPRTKYPIRITVTAWQYGRQGSIASAEPVSRTLYIRK